MLSYRTDTCNKILPETESESTLFLENRALFSANLGKVSDVHVIVLYILTYKDED